MKSLSVVVKSMSSLEIAELTGKDHAKVLIDIRKMLDELGILTSDFSTVRKVRGKEYDVFNLLISAFNRQIKKPRLWGLVYLDLRLFLNERL